MGEPYLEHPPRCIFCRSVAGPFDPADVFPKWSHDAIRSAGRLPIAIENGICAVCAAGWMRRLERSVQDVIEPVTNGDPMTLGSDQQAALACWITTTAWCAELAVRQADTAGRPPVHIPVGHFHWLNDRCTTPPGVRSWLGAVDADPTTTGYHHSVPLTPPGADRPSGQLATFSLGTCVFQVSGFDPWRVVDRVVMAAEIPSLLPPPALEASLVPIWPVADDRPEWPPAAIIRTGSLDDVARWNGELGARN